jgi:hypothetical protein
MAKQKNENYYFGMREKGQNSIGLTVPPSLPYRFTGKGRREAAK